MAKKKTVDPGLLYLQKIGFNRIRGKYGLLDRLTKLMGKSKADELIKSLENVAPNDIRGQYDIMYSSYDIITAFMEASYGDLIRKVCNYIADKKEYFGKEILEVGCGSGFITGFLALNFPESTIHAIDRNEKAVELAKKRVERLGLTNVVFHVGEAKDLTEQYDTVLLADLLGENTQSDRKEFFGKPLLELFNYYCNALKDYLTGCAAFVKQDGHILAFEECGTDPILYAYTRVLSDNTCGILSETHMETTCENGDQTNFFHAAVFKKGFSFVEPELSNWWADLVEEEQNRTSNMQLKNWFASLVIRQSAAELIKGVYVYSTNSDQIIGKAAVYYDKDKTHTFFYIANYNIGQIAYVDLASDLNYTLENLQTFIDTNSKGDCRCKTFSLVDDKEIISDSFVTADMKNPMTDGFPGF